MLILGGDVVMFGYKKNLVIVLCAISVSVPLPVSAADGIKGKLEEVTVTARKRTESFEDVPITVKVFTEADIESAGIERAKDFIALTPNATIVQVQSSGNTFISVRGISQNRNTEPSVAVLIDGVLLSQPSQFNQELFDIEQIECAPDRVINDVRDRLRLAVVAGNRWSDDRSCFGQARHVSQMQGMERCFTHH